MTAPQNKPQEGQHDAGSGSEGSSGAAGGSEAATGGQEGQEGNEGTTALTYADVIAALPDDQRSAITAEVSKKNAEARANRLRAKAAEEKLAGNGGQPQEGTQNAGNGGQGAGNGQQPPAGDGQSTAQLAAARAAVARSKVEAIAATAGFADPEDAAALLGDLTSYVEQDFTVDADAIRTDVDELLVKKPHLKRQEAPQGGGRPGRPKPDGSQGSSASGNGGPKRGGVDAGRELYRSKHKSPAAGNVQTHSA